MNVQGLNQRQRSTAGGVELPCRRTRHGSSGCGNSTWPEQGPGLAHDQTPQEHPAGFDSAARSRQVAKMRHMSAFRDWQSQASIRHQDCAVPPPPPRRRLTMRHHPYRWPDNPGARPRHVPRTSLRRRTPRPAAYPHLDADHWQDASIRRADTRTHRTRTHRLLGRRPLRANRDAHSPRCNGPNLHHFNRQQEGRYGHSRLHGSQRQGSPPNTRDSTTSVAPGMARRTADADCTPQRSQRRG